MSHVELPRPLEAYFAHAELDASDAGRRFTITLPYFDGVRLSRLQWWWSLTPAQQRIGGEHALSQARAVATARFRLHIEHWLVNNDLRLGGDQPIPQLEARSLPAPAVDEVAARPLASFARA